MSSGGCWCLQSPGGCAGKGTIISGIGKRKKLSMGEEPAPVEGVTVHGMELEQDDP